MYLSRLILNPRSRRVQRELARPYEMHRSVMRAFPDNLQPGEERVLWRVDEHPNLGLTLLVQSHDAPDWSWVAAEDRLTALEEPNPAMKQFDVTPTAGQSFAFRLRANPTKRMARGAAEGAGKRVGFYKEEEQLAWLTRKGEQHGFRVSRVQISPDEKLKQDAAIRRDDTTHKLELLSVQFDGVLVVTDPARLVQAIEGGIGSGKGFGCGLLSLAPVRG